MFGVMWCNISFSAHHLKLNISSWLSITLNKTKTLISSESIYGGKDWMENIYLYFLLSRMRSRIKFLTNIISMSSLLFYHSINQLVWLSNKSQCHLSEQCNLQIFRWKIYVVPIISLFWDWIFTNKWFGSVKPQ